MVGWSARSFLIELRSRCTFETLQGEEVPKYRHKLVIESELRMKVLRRHGSRRRPKECRRSSSSNNEDLDTGIERSLLPAAVSELDYLSHTGAQRTFGLMLIYSVDSEVCTAIKGCV